MSQHAKYHFSVTIKTDDEAVLQCLRALSLYAQATGNNRIPWGGTKREDWERGNHRVTFHFSSREYRIKFEKEALRVLPSGSWQKIDERDDDPAIPQS